MSLELQQRKIRVLIAKPGLDGHDRGAKVIARGLRDAGMEVIYTGIRQTPEQIVQTAIQEDVEVIGLSILSGAHDVLIPQIIEKMKENKLEPGKNVLLLVGGIVPKEDVEKLKKVGVNEVFGPGTPTTEIAKYIEENVKKLRKEV
ncbi:MAG: cobalamin B12-binding domain-containing protein [Candidatus Bathyarchaeota archaeon]